MTVRCPATTVDESNPNGFCVWCELPYGHAGKHHAALRPPIDSPLGAPISAAALDWPDPVEAGVWVVAGDFWGYEGPSQAVPYPTEAEAMRAANEESYLRAYFVPFGTDLREVMP